MKIDTDRTKTSGFDEYIQSDPCKFDHHDLFKLLQTVTLDFRLNDPYCSLVKVHPFDFKKNYFYILSQGWLSPGQSYVLEGKNLLLFLFRKDKLNV